MSTNCNPGVGAITDLAMVATVEEIVKKAYDYVIVGGGTTGLCLAARLTEDATCTVLVLETGEPNLNEQAIMISAQYGVPLGNPKYAWQHETVPQKHSNNKKYIWPRGKGLGGSSAVNFCIWMRPPAEDIDAFERLGNPGWNWTRYLEYSKKSETFHPASPEDVRAQRTTSDVQYHGTNNGGIHTMFPPYFPYELPVQDTFINLGIPLNKEPMSGSNLGTAMYSNNIDPSNLTRSYSATAFYTPIADRENLTVVTSAHVHRLITKKIETGDVTATGVEFLHGGTPRVVNAAKEVVLCAGTLKSPQILELSGIGDRSILEPLGIPVQADIPGVGTNMQEHIFIGVSFELQPGYDSLDPVRDPETGKQHFLLHEQKRGLFSYGMGGFTFAPISQLTEKAAGMISRQEARMRENAGDLPPSLLEQYKITLEHLKDDSIPDCEMITFPSFLSFPNPPEKGKNYISMLAASNRPFSRGTIHIRSKDPTVDPAIDPHYFEEAIDLEMFLEIVKYLRKLPETEPFKSLIVKELNPGPEINDEGLVDWVKDFMGTTFHTVGSLSMLPFETGGVVDPSLKVYKTTNIRVADISIVPLHVVAHTQATAYAIAEQAADIIKGSI